MHLIKRFDEIDSTNLYIKREYAGMEEGEVVLASHQLAGRGRLGRAWEDDSSSLLFSILLKKGFLTESVSLLPLLMGASILLALKEEGIKASIKWPNDIIVKGKKAAGILTEAISDNDIQAIIIGVGINLGGSISDASLADKAITLEEASSKMMDKEELLNLILREFDRLHKEYMEGDNSFIKLIRENSYLDGKEVSLDYFDKKKKGRVETVADDGRLIVIIDGKKEFLSSGEVSLESNYVRNQN